MHWGNFCPQLCNNVKGSFKCLCADGFKDDKGQGTECKSEGISKRDGGGVGVGGQEWGLVIFKINNHKTYHKCRVVYQQRANVVETV